MSFPAKRQESELKICFIFLFFFFFFFVTSITINHNCYKLKEGMLQLHVKNIFFLYDDNKYCNSLPKEAPLLSNFCLSIFSRLNLTKAWATWAAFNVETALCWRLHWRPSEVTFNLNGSMIYCPCICVTSISIVKKSLFFLIVYSVTTLDVDWRFKTRAWSLQTTLGWVIGGKQYFFLLCPPEKRNETPAFQSKLRH